MQTALYHLATGIHASVHAYRTPHGATSFRDPDTTLDAREKVLDPTSNTPSHYLPGWGAVKVVKAGPSGKTRGLKPHNVLREVLVLQRARHPNIVRIIDYAWSESVWEHQLALPLLAITLRILLDSPSLTPHTTSRMNDELPDLSRLSMGSSDPSPTLDILFRSIAFQLLMALAYLHSLGIAHRDIKPENIMLDWDGTVVLIDFGVCWDEEAEDWGGEWKENREEMCCEVGTGPYRAPELLFGATTYDPQAIDLWAAGCVLAEFFTPRSLFPTPDIDPLDGSYSDMAIDETPSSACQPRLPLFDNTYGDLGLAGNIFSIRGSPTPETWPTFSSLPDASKISFTPQPPTPLHNFLPGLSPLSTPLPVEQLLDSLLALDPSRRAPAATAVDCDVFTQAAVLVPPNLLGSAVYGRERGRLGCLEDAEGSAVVRLFEEIMGPSRRRWMSMV